MADGGTKRIQRRRTKGWRLPEGAVYVGRPTRWGNPFQVGESYPRGPLHRGGVVTVRDRAHAVDLYKAWLFHQQRAADLIPELHGKDLACWCPLDQPCHAEFLLDIANDRGGI